MPHTAPLTVSTTSTSYTSQDYSYFSPQAPFTSPSPSRSSGTLSVPNTPFTNLNPLASPYGTRSPTIAQSAATTTTTTTTTTTPGGPIIISTITLRNNSNVSSVSSAGGGSNSHNLSAHPPHPPHTASTHQSDDVLQQFALHIPPPPTLFLSLAAQRNPSSSSTSSSSSSVQSRAGMIQSSSSPQMSLSSTPEQHTLSVQLPRNVQPEMVTISANKGDRLRVVADAWGGGNECHYEWQISFPPHDIDMSAVHARFDPNGRLTLEVRRRAAMRARYY